jgi:hypothetical protein
VKTTFWLAESTTVPEQLNAASPSLKKIFPWIRWGKSVTLPGVKSPVAAEAVASALKSGRSKLAAGG